MHTYFQHKKNYARCVLLLTLLVAALCAALLSGCGQSKPISLKVVVLPHFETGAMAGDEIGEAQLVYEAYFTNSKEYTLADGSTLFVDEDKGLGMCITGEGKIETTSCLVTLLNDERFDLSKAYLLAVGCAGGNMEYATVGDVCVATAAIDYDLGHQTDTQDLVDPENDENWVPLDEVAELGVVLTNADLANEVVELSKDLVLESPEKLQQALQKYFPDEPCGNRGPQAIKGTCVTSDNYWKGETSHDLAVQKTEYYQCPDPYAATEMEDVAILRVAEMYGLLERTIVLRAIVNVDFVIDTVLTEEDAALMGERDYYDDSPDAIFKQSMENLFKVEQVVIDSILAGKLAA